MQHRYVSSNLSCDYQLMSVTCLEVTCLPILIGMAMWGLGWRTGAPYMHVIRTDKNEGWVVKICECELGDHYVRPGNECHWTLMMWIICCTCCQSLVGWLDVIIYRLSGCSVNMLTSGVKQHSPHTRHLSFSHQYRVHVTYVEGVSALLNAFELCQNFS